MATLNDIVATGAYEPIVTHLRYGEFEERKFYAAKNAINWLKNELPKLQTSIAEGRLGPREQVFEFLHTFITGGKLICEAGRDVHEMAPHGSDVWELKTRDVRLFGWFYKPAIFLCHFVDSKERLEKELKQNNIDLYAIYRNGVVQARKQSQLDEPKVADKVQVEHELCY